MKKWIVNSCIFPVNGKLSFCTPCWNTFTKYGHKYFCGFAALYFFVFFVFIIYSSRYLIYEIKKCFIIEHRKSTSNKWVLSNSAPTSTHSHLLPPTPTHPHPPSPTQNKFSTLVYQRAKRHANFSFLHANVPKGVSIFQIFLLRNAKGNFYTYYMKNSTLYLIS